LANQRIEAASTRRQRPQDADVILQDQSFYLTEVPTTFAEVIIGLIGQEGAPISLAAAKVEPIAADDLNVWERKLEQRGLTTLQA
jgi:hypothetical protein